MISPEYCVTMARYNQWQNNDIRRLVKGMDEEELRANRGAFFNSIFETLNHLLWGDLLWISRFDGGDGPSVPATQHSQITPNKDEWDRMRFLTDGRIREWAGQLKAVDLIGNVTWFSEMMQKDFDVPKTTCITHFFNHQTHHRGQVHAMMTAAGQRPTDTDLTFMPEH